MELKSLQDSSLVEDEGPEGEPSSLYMGRATMKSWLTLAMIYI